MNETKVYDVAIIGGGPAGMTAAVYASRANLTTVFIEKGAPGGKMVLTNIIENWTGDKQIKGFELAQRMFAHSTEFGAEYKYGDVQKIESLEDELKEITLSNGDRVRSRAIIISSGTADKVPEEIENINTFNHKGVSYCAICDGPIYKGETIGVLGSGNSAVEEATYLTTVAKKVNVYVRNKVGLKADKKSIDALKAKDNVEVFIGIEGKALKGDGRVERFVFEQNGQEITHDLKAFFPYIGLVPNTSFVEDLGITNEDGFIKTNESMETKIKNIYAAGDVREKHIRQIGTAVNDGIIAAKNITQNLG